MTKIDFALIREIINRVVAMALKDTLDIRDLDVGTKMIQWRPVWGRNKKTRDRELRRLEVRVGSMDRFSKVTNHTLEPMGIYMVEIYEYLEKSSACRVKADGSPFR